tara:strand:+ start:1549 stop:2355 length:807 start_codon:yes stop_codon:yes gene_type:complete
MRTNTLSEITKNLKELKLKKGSSCLIHSSIVGLGLIKDIPIKNIPKQIFDLVSKEIGKNGTMSALTPYYDYGLKLKKFDLKNSNSDKEVGSLSNLICRKKKSARSLNPLFNISSIGKKAKFITNEKTTTAFGTGSAWDQLFKLNSDIVFLGCNLSVCTFIRYIEFRFGVPYLYNKHFTRDICRNKKILSRYSSSTLRYSHLDIKYDTSKFEKILFKKKALRISKNKNINFMVVDMKSCFEIGSEELKKNIFFFLKRPPIYKNKLMPTI